MHIKPQVMHRDIHRRFWLKIRIIRPKSELIPSLIIINNINNNNTGGVRGGGRPALTRGTWEAPPLQYAQIKI